LKKCKKILSEDPKSCKTHINLSIDPETIPTLIPAKKLEMIQKDDNKPYYAVEEILDITEAANRVVFSKEFWESYLKVLNKRPIPGSKEGHTYYGSKTPDNDFYLIGAKIEKNKVFLKNYIPPEGEKSSNTRFIQDTKLGLKHFSIVAWTEDLIEVDENGMIKQITAIRSVKGERNDAVEVGMGAMDQKVNKDNKDKTDSENPKIKQEAYIMPDDQFKDMIKNLSNQIENGTVTKKELAKSLGIEIVTDKHTAALELVGSIIKIVGDKPIETIKEMQANEEKVKTQAYNNTREKLMSEAFGTEIVKIDGKEETNLKRQAAEAYVKTDIQTDEALAAEIKTAKENPVVLSFSFQEADFTAKTNIVKLDKKDSELISSEYEEI